MPTPEQAIGDAAGLQARAVVLSAGELARYRRDNPYPGEANPKQTGRAMRAGR